MKPNNKQFNRIFRRRYTTRRKICESDMFKENAIQAHGLRALWQHGKSRRYKKHAVDSDGPRDTVGGGELSF